MIVILDDEPYFISAYIDTLKMEGFDVILTQNEDSFFSVIKSVLPEAVIIDVMLSSGYDSGIKVYGKFKHLYPNIPSILLTNRENIENNIKSDNTIKILRKREITPINLVKHLNIILKKL